VLLILLGAGHVLEGLAALAGRRGGGALLISAPAWGWTSVVLGVAGGLVGLGLLAGARVARVLAVLLAVVSAVANLASLRDDPAAVVRIVVDVLVIYAVTLHGGELRATPYR
jgi:hypothetical protein